MSEETPTTEYAASAEELITPKKRGRPPKIEEAPSSVTVFVEDAPPVDAPEAVDETKLTAATRLEMEVGRKALENYR